METRREMAMGEVRCILFIILDLNPMKSITFFFNNGGMVNQWPPLGELACADDRSKMFNTEKFQNMSKLLNFVTIFEIKGIHVSTNIPSAGSVIL